MSRRLAASIGRLTERNAPSSGSSTRNTGRRRAAISSTSGNSSSGGKASPLTVQGVMSTTAGVSSAVAAGSSADGRDDRPLPARLADAGVDRRAFLKFCAGVTAVLALPPQFAPRVASALAKVTRPVVVWLEFQDCAGDTEAFVRSRDPAAADLILGLISLDYHETLMAPAGVAAEQARDAAVARGGHLLIVEGSVPTGIPGPCTIGGRTASDILTTAARGAAGIINVGTCSAFGG